MAREKGVAETGATTLEEELHGWMIRSLRGDSAAYEKLLGRISLLLRAYLTKSLGPKRGSRERAEDLVQEVLLALHHKRHTYEPGRPLLPWIYSIARYRMIDSIRAERRIPLSSELEEGADAQASLKQHADAERDAESVFGGDKDLAELLATLSDKQRTILLLAKVEEVPLAQIATRLSMSLSAVKVTIHRAMTQLKRKHGAPEPRSSGHED